MLSPTLIELFRYPVKSMMGESLTATEVTEAGIQGDRAGPCETSARGHPRRKKTPSAYDAGRANGH